MNGRNVVACEYINGDQGTLKAVNPATGLLLEGDFHKASETDVDNALTSASSAFELYRNLGKDKKAAFLNAIADEIGLIGEEVVARASSESGLPLARLQGELGRTTGQLRLFANLVAEGSWIDAVID
ncbi:MAG: aldehyde dehydrogenase family protein, partial [Sphingobacteriales bacterium]